MTSYRARMGEANMINAWEKLLRQVPADAVDRERALADLHALYGVMTAHFWPIGKEAFRSNRGKVRIHMVPVAMQTPAGCIDPLMRNGRIITQVAVHVHRGKERNPFASFVIGCPDADADRLRREALAAIGTIS